jgi:hypothetical protein
MVLQNAANPFKSALRKFSTDPDPLHSGQSHRECSWKDTPIKQHFFGSIYQLIEGGGGGVGGVLHV